MRTILLLLSVSAAALAQTWEIGGAGVYSAYRDLTVTNGSASATAGFQPDAGFSLAFGEQLYGRVSGELRYSLLLNNLKVSNSSQEVTRDGHSHALHYDLLVFMTSKESAIRPFLAGGAGIKIFSGTGVETAAQPLNQFVSLTHTYQTRPLVSAGGGLKFRLSQHLVFRADFRDYISPIPRQVITPGPGTRMKGLLHDFIGMGGISYVF